MIYRMFLPLLLRYYPVPRVALPEDLAEEEEKEKIVAKAK